MVGVGYWVVGGVFVCLSCFVNEEIWFGCVGVDGKGFSDLVDVYKLDNGWCVVVMCDIDEIWCVKKCFVFIGVKEYSDYCKMFEEMGDFIDVVMVSILDYIYVFVVLMVMWMGKYCFC